MKVLLVEDNAADLRKILSLLAACRIEAVRADSLASAQMVLLNITVDAVLADLSLADSSGVDTVIRIHRTAPRVPLIVLSGHEDIEMARNCVRAGASSYVVKSSDLSSETVERELMYAVERQRRAASLAGFLYQVVPDDLLAPYITSIDRGIEEAESYLRRNHPNAAAEVNRILERNRVFFALQELRGVGKGTEEAQLATFRELATHMQHREKPRVATPVLRWLILSYLCGAAMVAAWFLR